MSEYNISFLIKEMQFCMGESQNEAGKLLLNTVAIHESVNVNVDDKMVTNLVKRKNEVHEAIQSAINNKDVIAYAKEKVKELLEDHLSQLMQIQASFDILKRMRSDENVPGDLVDRLQKEHDTGDFVQFFTDAILYALGKRNTLPEYVVKSNDFYFLHEVHQTCPLCGKKLWKKNRGKILNRYRVVKIYPDDLDTEFEKKFNVIAPRPTDPLSVDNQIALCPDCAENYLLDPNEDTYKELLQKKGSLSRMMKEQEVSSESTIEAEIVDVIKAVSEVTSPGQLQPFHEVLSLDEKFTPENFNLKGTVEDWVNRYYSYVEQHFSIDGTNSNAKYDVIRAEVNTIYLKYKDLGMNQQEICDEIADWMLSKNGLEDEYSTASHIVVAFFIQNCAIFDAVS